LAHGCLDDDEFIAGALEVDIDFELRVVAPQCLKPALQLDRIVAGSHDSNLSPTENGRVLDGERVAWITSIAERLAILTGEGAFA
jgi:hypothetical protein